MCSGRNKRCVCPHSSRAISGARRHGRRGGGDTAPRLGPPRRDRYKPCVLLHGALIPNLGTKTCKAGAGALPNCPIWVSSTAEGSAGDAGTSRTAGKPTRAAKRRQQSFHTRASELIASADGAELEIVFLLLIADVLAGRAQHRGAARAEQQAVPACQAEVQQRVLLTYSRPD